MVTLTNRVIDRAGFTLRGVLLIDLVYFKNSKLELKTVFLVDNQ